MYAPFRLPRAFALLLAVTLLAASPMLAEDLTLDEIVAKNIEARGGAEAWKKVKSARVAATMAMPAMGVEAPFVIEFKRPNMVRVDITMQGMVMTNAYDGEVGWQVMPLMGKPDPEELPEDQLKQLLDQADFEGPLVDWKEKGHQVELVGKEDLEGTEVYKLKVTKKDGDIVYSFLDAEYFLEVQQVGTQNMQGVEVEATTVMADYKEVGDLIMPHAFEMSFGGPSMQTLTIDSIELDPEIDDARFAMPKAKANDADAEGDAG